jgi:hypothetical protein
VNDGRARLCRAQTRFQGKKDTARRSLALPSRAIRNLPRQSEATEGPQSAIRNCGRTPSSAFAPSRTQSHPVALIPLTFIPLTIRSHPLKLHRTPSPAVKPSQTGSNHFPPRHPTECWSIVSSHHSITPPFQPVFPTTGCSAVPRHHKIPLNSTYFHLVPLSSTSSPPGGPCS